MIDEAIKAIKESSKSSSVYIGTDSIVFKRSGLWYARYTTVVILHMDSCHGAKIFPETVEMQDYRNLRMRLINEVSLATQVALEIVDHLDGRHMEIHLDINPNPIHKSNLAVKEALGYVRGTLGIEAKIKPHAFAASRAADHCVKGKLIA